MVKADQKKFNVPKAVLDFLRHYVSGIQKFVVKDDDAISGMEELQSNLSNNNQQR